MDERDTLAVDCVRAVAARDKYQANGKRYKAQLAETDALFAIPGVFDAARRAARAATHPDRAKGEADRRARTAKFQDIEAAFDRIKERQS